MHGEPGIGFQVCQPIAVSRRAGHIEIVVDMVNPGFDAPRLTAGAASRGDVDRLILIQGFTDLFIHRQALLPKKSDIGNQYTINARTGRVVRSETRIFATERRGSIPAVRAVPSGWR